MVDKARKLHSVLGDGALIIEVYISARTIRAACACVQITVQTHHRILCRLKQILQLSDKRPNANAPVMIIT